MTDSEDAVAAPEAQMAADGEDAGDALDLLFQGRVEELVPPEELGELHDFIRDEAIMRRRFTVSIRLDCTCLAWIGYALANVVTHEDGLEFTARAMKSYIPECAGDVENPCAAEDEGPFEDPPEEFEDWPIWPFEIYQDEADLADEEMEEADDGD
ncbi:MAG: hypothetical protein OXI03_05920 [Chloroflexota bacterium]|nr:hypothetical protein [Chloroflexota bacterium]